MPHSQNTAPRGSVRIARGASPWLLPTVATAAVSLVRSRRSKRAAALAVPATALAAGMLWFFRDPEREIA
ncbi:phosphatidylserine decarboxylase family protein, partial [Streptomyces albidoflavus]